MKAQADTLYPSYLNARLPREVADALSANARARFTTVAEYSRQLLIRGLREDGVALETNSRA